MTLSDLDLGWLSRIFNDTKRRAVSLRQLSFLFVAICRAHYIENVEWEALAAVARWSAIGKVVSFYVALKAVEWRGLSDRRWYVIPGFRGTVGEREASLCVAIWQNRILQLSHRPRPPLQAPPTLTTLTVNVARWQNDYVIDGKHGYCILSFCYSRYSGVPNVTATYQRWVYCSLATIVCCHSN